MSIIQASSHHHVKVFKLKPDIDRTTIRSSHGSWFIGTLFNGEHFFHIPGNHSHENGYIWGYSHNEYGAYGGFGWVRVKDLAHPQPLTTRLQESTVYQLHHPISLRSRNFIKRYADHPYPPEHSTAGTGKIDFKKGAIVPFYANQKGGNPKHPHKKGSLTSTDDVKARYIVLHTHKKLIAVDYIRHGFRGHKTPSKGDGIWGFILKMGDNFTYEI